ncbi:glutamate 5-kinase [Gluconobacter sphaericus]|uniref:Glutamate 5-kinase n=1 Tax=Gluconobacter sphaericus NBRC 12467 TaxID=1307951 RepID=A0AA37WCK3_9PROT|nr:glutamate 5-kinase [Gluconobacter sphaericus]MBF0886329.1 glutamate 5-kinase [Gluconobacter sphaericus]MBS1086327.1 glutamate 5-kinase [Gluconobacter sphaericus]MBS1100325.1 glutamate 5-kinase [Gluconobacter sphaericus]QQX91237.1 glutamate 5-kinase [Gluconobacter sphaericus]GBR52552.1 gamma-glutamyl kinase [Gluconobacter sphaericus NBRC 12467]
MTAPASAPHLAQARRIVIKIGSALLVDSANASLRLEWLQSVCADIADLRARGAEVIVVSSGAISLARHRLGLTSRRLRLDEKQAMASVGQIGLAQGWSAALAAHDLVAAQLLLTPDDTESRERHLNARATLQTLLDLGCVPVINENDAIATGEIRFGDNDRLGARVAQMTGADCLVLLSDIDGLYTADPRQDPSARHIPIVEQMTDEIMAMGGEPPPGYSSGGMRTKLLAARIATRAGANMVIAAGQEHHPLHRLQNSGLCTWFIAQTDAGSARKRWIRGSLQPKGILTIDAGARRALEEGASLLPAGVTGLEGSFVRGDLVLIRDADESIIGHGLIAYDSEESQKLIGHRSGEMEQLLGYRGRDALIHRDDLALDLP